MLSLFFWCLELEKTCDLISSSLGASCSPAKLQSAVTGAPQSNGWEAPGPMLRARRMHHQWPGGGLPGPCPKWQKFHLENFNKESLRFCMVLIEHTFFLLSDDLYTMQVAMLWEVVGQCALDECVFLGGAIWWKDVLRFSGHKRSNKLQPT